MKKQIGIWLDHKKAFIVTIKKSESSWEEDTDVTVTEMVSEVERKVRLSGGARTRSTPWGPQEVSVDSKIEVRQKQQLRKFYHQIMEVIKDADKVLIMGPGEAKLELKKEVATSKTRVPKIIDVQTCDKMTINQVTATVKSYFEKK
jgi:hypothetical protein